MRVAVLGTGIMGFPIARNAAGAGIEVRAWNRTAERAEPLSEHGVEVASEPADAVRGTDLFATVLTDTEAVLSVVDRELLEAAGDAVWVQMSTIGLEGTARCAELAQQAGVELVDAPVVGTKQPAEQGELMVLASGPEDVQDRCKPLFDAIGKRTVWLGPAGEGTRYKLIVNAWLVGVVESLAETIALAEGLGAEPRRFLELIEGGPMDLAYAQLKGKAMIERSFETAFPLAHAAKDAGLVLDAAGESGLSLPLVETVREQMARAIELGHGEEDMAATVAASMDSRSP
jgi:3-hydroxyisobutyrate dehydrogenase